MTEKMPNHKYFNFTMGGTIAAHNEDEAWREFRNYYTLDELMSTCDITEEPADEDGEIHPGRLADLRAYDEDCPGCQSGEHDPKEGE